MAICQIRWNRWGIERNGRVRGHLGIFALRKPSIIMDVSKDGVFELMEQAAEI